MKTTIIDNTVETDETDKTGLNCRHVGLRTAIVPTSFSPPYYKSQNMEEYGL